MPRTAAGTRTSAGSRSSAGVRRRDGAAINSLDTVFMYHNYLTDQETIDSIAEYATLGISTVICTATRFKTTDCATNAYGWWSRMPGHLQLILDECARWGMKCYVGLVESSNVCIGFYDEPNKSHDVAQYTSVVTTLLASYGSHSALAGWYLIDEQALPYEQRSDHLANAQAYFLAVRNAIRALSALPIIVAPYLGNVDGQGLQTPAQVAQKCLDFVNNTGGDIIINMQDSTGADGISIGWARSGDRAYPVRQYYEAIAAAITPAKLWSDNELFNYPSGSFVGANYQPASAVRIAHQLAHSAVCAKRSCWLPTTHMTASNSDAHAMAASLLARYKARMGIAGTWARPTSYTWTTAREAAHPDKGNALFDDWTADPRNVNDPAWIGFANGGCVVVIDLGASTLVNWVAVHTAEFSASSYKHPTSIQIEHSPDNSAWTNAGTTTPGLAAADGEYMIGNTSRLALTCRYLRITLANATNKTLLSEMEIVTNA